MTCIYKFYLSLPGLTARNKRVLGKSGEGCFQSKTGKQIMSLLNRWRALEMV